ncbi:sigma-70 family RNA polymerase sigma factor [Candidatus Poribacteria bacterium]|jgi:RNA polymerase sigma factor (sigma-70 family)|nr:sigma-70 family RNA polymerase sigma factor [Candidatus Poribacteria bacterium]MBT5532788.1 sigma-70 family RNA polymerase sigma factor [Candidatus Poribacteria bacterium]MBT5711972.1 sigma-70 family RNA polymerase sigma factor [Candidatus Poribacteria bacterium]MBT7808152.1 sigma-70 family RNA polymerase sigma factor [Candidatus Poribacteria bacterium]
MQRPDPFDEAVLSQLPRIRAIGRGLLPRDMDTDDFVQDVIVRVYLNRAQLRDEERLPQWIASIASNAARTARRGRPSLPTHALTLDVARDPSPAEQVISAERWRQVIRALNDLGDADRELLTARYIDEQDREDIRGRHGATYTALTTRLHRARGRLRKRLRAVLGLGVAALAGASRRARAFGAAPIATGGGGAMLGHAVLAGAVWLLIAHGQHGGEVPAARVASVRLVEAKPIGRATPRRTILPDGSDRHEAGDAGYARLGEGHYLGASSPLFDYVGEDGLTVEAWYYFDEEPRPLERWVLLRKEGSYYAEYWGPERKPSQWWTGPEVRPSFAQGTGPGLDGSGRGSLDREGFPPERWVHVALQYYRTRRLKPDREGPLRYEYQWHARPVRHAGDSASAGFRTIALVPPEGGSRSDAAFVSMLPRTDAPLVIGGMPSLSPADASSATHSVGSVRGRVGEVRVSSTARYPYREGARSLDGYGPESVAGRFEADEHTIALWHFDEGPGAKEYADASGHGHTLYVRATRK